jgi:ribosome biogenesis GTPase / thiamine phosphate phosphatase
VRTETPSLNELGWETMTADQSTLSHVSQGHVIGRVIALARGQIEVVTATGALLCTLTGKFKHDSQSIDFPTVGDWVTVLPGSSARVGSITGVVRRNTLVARKAAGDTTEAQPLASNVDVLIIAMAFGSDFNVRRLERFLAMAYESGAAPIVALTKADTVTDEVRDALTAEVMGLMGLGHVFAVSSKTGVGLELIRAHMGSKVTMAIVGSSGVGKSTLLNALAGEIVMATGDVRNDGRGRHTTKHRQLLMLHDGTLFIDTPGLRELQLWDAEAGMGEAFPEIDDVATACRFSDCQHNQEPGCAVHAALANGVLDSGRVESWKKLHAELATLATRQVERDRAIARGRRR